jgi:hypothetical protein
MSPSLIQLCFELGLDLFVARTLAYINSKMSPRLLCFPIYFAPPCALCPWQAAAAVDQSLLHALARAAAVHLPGELFGRRRLEQHTRGNRMSSAACTSPWIDAARRRPHRPSSIPVDTGRSRDLLAAACHPCFTTRSSRPSPPVQAEPSLCADSIC